MFRNAVPRDIAAHLRRAFAPGAPYWKQTDYDKRGYFSFWYDVSCPPTNAVESLIQRLMPLISQNDIVGAEWWVHTRLSGRNLGHQVACCVYQLH